MMNEPRSGGGATARSADVEAWRAQGVVLGREVRRNPWAVGEWANEGRALFKLNLRQCAAVAGVDYGRMRTLAAAAKTFPLSRRRDSLSPEIHIEVKRLPEAEWDRWLLRAEGEHWGLRQLRREIRDWKLLATRRTVVASAPHVTAVEELVVHADMRDFLPTLRDIDLLLVDPPYDAPVALFDDLGRLARPVIAAGGILAVMLADFDQREDQIRDVMKRHIRYWRTLPYVLMDRSKLSARGGLRIEAKPVLCFAAGTPRVPLVTTVVRVEETEKDLHPWQQSLAGFRELVRRLSRPGGRVADVCLGSATTAVAALAEGRSFVGGCDIDPDIVAVAKARIAEALAAVGEYSMTILTARTVNSIPAPKPSLERACTAAFQARNPDRSLAW